jgi:hypothetical protein
MFTNVYIWNSVNARVGGHFVFRVAQSLIYFQVALCARADKIRGVRSGYVSSGITWSSCDFKIHNGSSAPWYLLFKEKRPANIGFAASGGDGSAIGNRSLIGISYWGDRFLNEIIQVSNLITKPGSVAGRKECCYSDFANTWPLAAILSQQYNTELPK